MAVNPTKTTRRAVLRALGTGSTLLLGSCVGPSRSLAENDPDRRAAADAAGTPPPPSSRRAKVEDDEGVAAAEDLMREHGALERLLLVYETSRTQLDGGDFDADLLHRAAQLMRDFVESYHEKLEEEHVFPLLHGVEKYTALVDVLAEQHDAGRRVTDVILRESVPGRAGDRSVLGRAIDAYLRMYRPHAAREDTVLFPGLREVLSPEKLADLGEKFEDIEHERFGERGFERVVDQVAELERALGIYDLSQFTPRPSEG